VEAFAPVPKRRGPENCLFIHVTLIPTLAPGARLRQATQHSVMKLREMGIQPDVLICRTRQPLSDEMKEKISLFCDVDKEAVIEAMDIETIYEVPLRFEELGWRTWSRNGWIAGTPGEPGEWEEIIERIKHPAYEVSVGVWENTRAMAMLTSRLQSLSNTGGSPAIPE